jgi:hypothetical protein
VKRKKNIELTLRRHFFNNNPDNPFEPYDPDVNAPRPNHSLFPDFYTVHPRRVACCSAR